MDFLALCKQTARIAGTIAGLPNFTTVVGATGRIAKLTGAVNDAWVNIQSERTDWLWMRRTFEKPLIIGQNSYSPADLDLTRVAQWMPDRIGFNTFSIYDADEGKANESDIYQIGDDYWRQMYGRGVHDRNRVSNWSIDPGTRNLLVGPTPDKAYILAGEYRATAQELVADDDTPEMPEQYHRVIIAEAIRLLSKSDEAYQAMMVENEEYIRQRNGLVHDQTPQITIGDGPLA